MLVGRLIGWLMVGVAVIMASADAVMALGPADYAGLMTADVLTLLTGGEHEAPLGLSLWNTVATTVLDTPAWALTGGLGLIMVYAFRKRQRRYRFRER